MTGTRPPGDAGRIVLRETAVSIVINVVLSILFFIAVFGLATPVSLGALGPDFYPQTFMITLMGTLVPTLLLRRKLGGPIRPIVLRSLVMAVAFAAVLGTLAWWLCANQAGVQMPALSALLLKAIYGGVLAAAVTPLALRILLTRSTTA